MSLTAHTVVILEDDTTLTLPKGTVVTSAAGFVCNADKPVAEFLGFGDFKDHRTFVAARKYPTKAET